MHRLKLKPLLFLFLTLFCASAFCEVKVDIYSTQELSQNGKPKLLGNITFEDSLQGLEITPDLQGLVPGRHGFHLHDKASCKEGGKAAEGHLDPNQTGKHLGPDNTQGHLGDLPTLFVDENGDANKTIYAPRLKVSDIYNHSVIIHEGSDNFWDHPQPLGGGGNRIACGVIKN